MILLTYTKYLTLPFGDSDASETSQFQLSNPIKVNEQFTAAIAQSPSFNELEQVISPQAALDEGIDAGANPELNTLQLSFGGGTIPQFGERYVWKLEERNRDGEELVATYYIDARTGDALQ